MISALDLPAVRRGALLCLLVATPAAVISALLADNESGTDQSNWVYVALLAIVAAYLAGGAVAGKAARESPFANGAAAAFMAFAVVQIIGIVIRLARGDDVSLIALAFNSLLAASIGAVGAGFGVRRGTLDTGGGEPTG